MFTKKMADAKSCMAAGRKKTMSLMQWQEEK